MDQIGTALLDQCMACAAHLHGAATNAFDRGITPRLVMGKTGFLLDVGDDANRVHGAGVLAA